MIEMKRRTTHLPLWLLILPVSFAFHSRRLTNYLGGVRNRFPPTSNSLHQSICRENKCLFMERDRNDEENESKSLWSDIYSIAIPGLAACLVEPALSLVDTFFVGQSKVAAVATIGLAGMSVNGALFNVIAAATGPLGTSTTTVISKVLGSVEQDGSMLDQKDRDKLVGNATSRLFFNGVAISTTSGIILSSFLLIFSEKILQYVFGIIDPIFYNHQHNTVKSELWHCQQYY